MSDYIYYKFKNDQSFFAIDSSYIRDCLPNQWSTYYIQEELVRMAMRSRLINDNDYVLCPLYGELITREFGDFQFSATETYKRDESDFSAFDRCLGEELGLFYDNDDMPYNEQFIHGGKEWFNTIININELTKIRFPRRNDNRPDNARKKMSTIVYGNKRNILNYLNGVIKFDASNDDIVGVVAIKFKEAKRQFLGRTIRS